MVSLRSLFFNSIFYMWTLFCGILFLPTLLLPRSFILKIAHFWVQSVVWLCDHLLGLHFKVQGKVSLLKTPSIFAVKHQSVWETIVFYALLSDPAVVLKKDILWIPFFGWYLRKLNVIPLSRSKNKGGQDLKRLLQKAQAAVACGRPILIFPEGTRSKPGEKGIYKSGVASLYVHLKKPVVPVAHNAGLFWPRRTFLKYPGEITVDVLEPLNPGLSRQEFMRILERRIEEKTNELVYKEKPLC
ncbi:MAG: hypothetical protein ACD_16C00235G0014 [uncultured bacterium]|nr:MAG: hypothetical protein ACD_16C00235G0014 [uncultured bacterium]OFW69965.1 MAG: hypothetical protein A2X70_00125 [Alphaproteobacteria bacterium GWC2_42_16]OFW74444.1 MAG: hypothetical protein A2Z80_05390 [Alphaproteobacteria bacterium GWA2_41_27]OFW84797.1 MAG: hypothetical protein A3E50_00850 [Alphaproteobacteria bacterium RIFCSPHIGHO2_12_FULL_42_100]OFW86660.1 MAG: hypothetical protein A2W06_04630 [Alphaproteobacteria bacterium RBG_16_42_14]OFW90672.1 MAG: hypothetical protein A3C41_046